MSEHLKKVRLPRPDGSTAEIDLDAPHRELQEKIDTTNERIDTTNERIDTTNERVSRAEWIAMVRQYGRYVGGEEPYRFMGQVVSDKEAEDMLRALSDPTRENLSKLRFVPPIRVDSNWACGGLKTAEYISELEIAADGDPVYHTSFLGSSSIKRINKLSIISRYTAENSLGNSKQLESVDYVYAAVACPGLFRNCESLRNCRVIDVHGDDYSSMFSGCKALNSQMWPAFNGKNINVSYMFMDCELSAIGGVADFSNVVNSYGIFSGCTALDDFWIRGLGTKPEHTYFDASDTPWGERSHNAPRTSLNERSFDRAAAGYTPMRVALSEFTKSLLKDSEIAAITAKGYTIV